MVVIGESECTTDFSDSFRDVSEDFGSFSHQEESVLEKEEENKQLRMGSQCCGSRLLLNHQ